MTDMIDRWSVIVEWRVGLTLQAMNGKGKLVHLYTLSRHVQLPVLCVSMSQGRATSRHMLTVSVGEKRTTNPGFEPGTSL